MRIIGGRNRGTRLFSPKGRNVRPTRDAVRETLFNLIEFPSPCRFLELYAGSGAVGLEALSRGALFAAFVERDRGALEIIERNVDRCRARKTVEVHHADVFTFLSSPPTSLDGRFHIVFADPPYSAVDDGELQKLLAALDRGWLHEEHLVILERDQAWVQPPWLEDLTCHLECRRSGRARLVILSLAQPFRGPAV